MSKKLNIEKQDLFNLYVTQGFSLQEIATKFNVSHGAILYWMKKFQINRRDLSSACKGVQLGTSKKRIYSLNEDFFKFPSSDMFWVLGFIAADGCIERSRTWSVCQKKIEPIIKIKKHIGYTGPIEERKIFRLRVNSNKHVDDLNKFGIIKRKSLILNFPVIPNEYFWDFVRGYFDGDGSIFKRNRCVNGKMYRPVYVNFVGSHSFINSLAKKISENLNIPKQTLILDGKNKKVSKIVFRNRKYILKMMTEIYNGSHNDNRLNRKYRRFKNWLKEL